MNRNNHLDFLDSLRGIAILGVILSHCIDFSPKGYKFKALHDGAMGVQLFYVVSAFTIFYTLSQSDFSFSRKKIGGFLIRRIFRIAPLYFLFATLYLIVPLYEDRVFWLNERGELTIVEILFNFTLLHDLHPYSINSMVPGGWSIGVEFLFYLIVPFLFSVIRNSKQAFVFLIFSLVFSSWYRYFMSQLSLIHDHEFWNTFVHLTLPSQLPLFAIGIFLYTIYIEKKNNSSSGNVPVVLSILLLVGFLISLLKLDSRFVFPELYLYGLFFAFLFTISMNDSSKLIRNSFFSFIGMVSYSTYFVHFAIIFLIKYYGFFNWGNESRIEIALIIMALKISIVILTSVFISWIIHKCVEVPFINIGKRISAKINA